MKLGTSIAEHHFLSHQSHKICVTRVKTPLNANNLKIKGQLNANFQTLIPNTNNLFI